MKSKKEMNGIERIAFRNVEAVFNSNIGGWYNCIMDGYENDIPSTMEIAKEIVYEEAMNNYASSDGSVYWLGRAPREMRFAGSKFVKECIDYLFDADSDGDIMEIAYVKGWDGK